MIMRRSKARLGLFSVYIVHNGLNVFITDSASQACS